MVLRSKQLLKIYGRRHAATDVFLISKQPEFSPTSLYVDRLISIRDIICVEYDFYDKDLFIYHN